jgi:hypothetical protein
MKAAIETRRSQRRALPVSSLAATVEAVASVCGVVVRAEARETGSGRAPGALLPFAAWAGSAFARHPSWHSWFTWSERSSQRHYPQVWLAGVEHGPVGKHRTIFAPMVGQPLSSIASLAHVASRTSMAYLAPVASVLAVAASFGSDALSCPGAQAATAAASARPQRPDALASGSTTATESMTTSAESGASSGGSSWMRRGGRRVVTARPRAAPRS